MQPAVEAYPEPPEAVASTTHAVRVDGQPILVEQYTDIGYVRFAMSRPVSVEIEVAMPIGNHTVFPSRRVAWTEVSGNKLTLRLDAPESVVVWIDELDKLVLLPDPPVGDNPPAHDALSITDFGAEPSGRSLATAAIQAAIDSAARRDRPATVLIPPGLYRSGTLALRSGITLYLAPGAVLKGSPDPADYPVDLGRHESHSDASLPPELRFLGRTMTFSRLLLVDDAHDVRITGRGTIDGEGTFLRTRRGAAPNLVRVRSSRAVTISDVLLRNSAAWTVHLLASSDVRVENVKVINDRDNLNTDGIDPDMSSDVTIDRSFIYGKDDAICIKATRNSDLSGEPHAISVSHNLVSARDAALKVGSESEAARFSDIRFEDNFVFESGRAMSVVVCDGATYDGVAFRRVEVGPDVDHLVEQVIGSRDGTGGLGHLQDLALEDIAAPSFTPPASNWTWYAQFRPARPQPGTEVDVFEGADEAHAVDGVTLRRLVVNGRHLRTAAEAQQVANLTIGNHVRRVSFE